MEISHETARALRSYIRIVEYAKTHVPDGPCSEIFACACLGPLPNCPCVERDRLVQDFLYEVSDGEAQNRLHEDS